MSPWVSDTLCRLDEFHKAPPLSERRTTTQITRYRTQRDTSLRYKADRDPEVLCRWEQRRETQWESHKARAITSSRQFAQTIKEGLPTEMRLLVFQQLFAGTSNNPILIDDEGFHIPPKDLASFKKSLHYLDPEWVGDVIAIEATESFYNTGTFEIETKKLSDLFVTWYANGLPGLNAGNFITHLHLVWNRRSSIEVEDVPALYQWEKLLSDMPKLQKLDVSIPYCGPGWIIRDEFVHNDPSEHSDTALQFDWTDYIPPAILSLSAQAMTNTNASSVMASLQAIQAGWGGGIAGITPIHPNIGGLPVYNCIRIWTPHLRIVCPALSLLQHKGVRVRLFQRHACEPLVRDRAHTDLEDDWMPIASAGYRVDDDSAEAFGFGDAHPNSEERYKRGFFSGDAKTECFRAQGFAHICNQSSEACGVAANRDIEQRWYDRLEMYDEDVSQVMRAVDEADLDTATLIGSQPEEGWAVTMGKRHFTQQFAMSPERYLRVLWHDETENAKYRRVEAKCEFPTAIKATDKYASGLKEGD